MTTATQAIKAAYREAQIVALVATPNSNELNEALDLLNQIHAGVLGVEVGTELDDLNLGGDHDQSRYLTPFVPENVRLVVNASTATNVKLSPFPYEGQRLAIVDVPGNFSTNNFTVDANGRTIELELTETLAEDGFYGEWLYRADIANWVRMTDLGLDDDLPLPEEFDPYFITRLAMRLNPRNGVTTAQETVAELQRAERKLKARYRKRRHKQDMPHLRHNRFGCGGLAEFNRGC